MRNPALATLIAGLSVGIVITLALLAQAHEEKRRKSIALAILRTETARQLQEIWGSPGPYFGIKSETLAALAGQEPAHLQPVKQRFTIAFAAEGNPLGLILGAAPLLEDMEKRLPGNLNETPIRLDLRLYKAEARAVKDLFNGDVDLLEMNVRDYFHAKTLNRGIQCLVSFISWPEAAGLRSDGTVIFTRADTGIKTMSDLRNRSFLFGTTDSSLTFWAKVYLVEAGISAKELSKYRYVDSPVDLAKHAVVLPDAPSLGNPFSDMTPVEAVVQGFYDAGVATEKRFLQVVSTEKLVLLTRFRDSGSLLVAKSELPASTARSFQLTLIDMKDLRILQTFPGNPSGFKAYADRDFSEVLQQLKSETKFDEDSLADK
jgi:ABC-type phosphate/phosphonate transport system substrate-binding protein